METVQQILTTEFEALKNDLIAAYDAKGMRSSGEWPASLQVEVSGNKATLTGNNYTEQLEYGRRPGKQPPSEAIERWIIDKGIAATIQGNISISSLAYLIARKIAREGWNRAQRGGVDLISEVVTPERIQSIIDKVSDIYVLEFTNDFIEQLKDVA